MNLQAVTSSHRIARSLALATGLSALLLSQSPALAGDGCDSATKVAADLWKNWGEELRKGGCLTATALAAILSEGATTSQSSAIYKKCYSTLDQFNDVAQGAVEKWNSLVGNKWPTLGPRTLELGKTMSGTVVGPGDRMFLTAAPLPANTSEVEIELKKEDGKSETEVTVCKVAANGQGTTIWNFTIDSGKDNQGKTWKKTFKGLDGYVLSVFLNSKSVTRTMEYELKATARESLAKITATTK